MEYTAGFGAVEQLMYVGNYEEVGLAVGPDLSATAKTFGWGGVAVWAYGKYMVKDENLEQKGLYVAIGGFAASFLL